MLCERSISRLEYKSHYSGWRGIALALVVPVLLLTMRLISSQPLTWFAPIGCFSIFVKLVCLRPEPGPDFIADLFGYRLIQNPTALSHIGLESNPYEIPYQSIASLRPQPVCFGLFYRPVLQTTDGNTYRLNYFLSFSRARVVRTIDEITRFMATGRPASQ